MEDPNSTKVFKAYFAYTIGPIYDHARDKFNIIHSIYVNVMFNNVSKLQSTFERDTTSILSWDTSSKKPIGQV